MSKMNDDYQLRVATNLHANFVNCTLAQLDSMAVMANCVLTQIKEEGRAEAKRDNVRFVDTATGKEYKRVNEYCTMIERRRFYLLDQLPPRNIAKRRANYEQVTKPVIAHCKEVIKSTR